MAAISGQVQTFNFPNFVGELFGLTPTETPFLSMAGGLNGGVATNDKRFTWQTYDLANPNPDQAALEGADPTYEGRDIAEVYNVCQIFQYGVETSYTRQATRGQLGPFAAARDWATLGDVAVTDPHDWQLQRKLEQAARDVEAAFLTGTFQDPANNATARKTRGILTAITTNAIAAAGAALSTSLVDQLMRTMFTNGAPFRNPVIFCNVFQKQQLSALYGYAPEDRRVGGLNIEVIETDVERMGVVIDRHMPADTLMIADMSVIRPRFLTIPGKGHFFMEPLAQTGAAIRSQLYGEIGLEYGPENWHGKITGLATS